MINIADNFGQASSRVSGQERGSLKSILHELQGFRVSIVAGASAGSGDLVPVATVTAYDTLLAVFTVGDSGGLVRGTVGNNALAVGSTNNFINQDDYSNTDLVVFWYDEDAGSAQG
jgi:hypothetical protein